MLSGNSDTPCAMSGTTKHATSVNMPLLRLRNSEGKFTMSRTRARIQILLQAQKLHIYGSGTFGAFGQCLKPPGASRGLATARGSARHPEGGCEVRKQIRRSQKEAVSPTSSWTERERERESERERERARESERARERAIYTSTRACLRTSA